MLSIQEIELLAGKRGLQMAKRRADSVTIWFQPTSPDPEAWATLMTDLTEVPVTIYGTRQVTGSGATDNRLFPAYAALIPDVNAKRASIGLGRVSN